MPDPKPIPREVLRYIESCPKIMQARYLIPAAIGGTVNVSDIAAYALALQDALRGVVAATEASEEAGCLLYLDAWDDAEAFWEQPLERARALLPPEE